ncbi:MAG: hypothetical protein RR454_00320 [Clostridia bacterium]
MKNINNINQLTQKIYIEYLESVILCYCPNELNNLLAFKETAPKWYYQQKLQTTVNWLKKQNLIC